MINIKDIYSIRADKDSYIINETEYIPMDSVLYDNPLNNVLENFGLSRSLITLEEATITYEKKKISLFEKTIEKHLNIKAQYKGYDDIRSAALRAALPNSPFHQEGLAYAEWMDGVWAYCYQELDKIKQGLRVEPSLEEFILELPQLNLQ